MTRKEWVHYVLHATAMVQGEARRGRVACYRIRNGGKGSMTTTPIPENVGDIIGLLLQGVWPDWDTAKMRAQGALL